MYISWKQSLRIAFTYIGTVVGAGFASGREILEFFVRYGVQGFVGILIACMLFIWAGVQVMTTAHRIQADSYQEMSEYLFGRWIGSIFNVILLITLLGTTSVMLAATGSLARETFHIPSQIGIWMTIISVYLITLRGLDAIHSVNSVFVPLLIAFTLLAFFYTRPWEAAISTNSVPIATPKTGVWLTSPLYYVALNVALTQAVLIPIGKGCENRRTLIWGGILGGLGIGLLLFLAFTSLSVHMPQIMHVEMPMIYLLSGVGKGLTLFFALLVYGEVFSTLIANVFGLVQQVKRYVALSPPTMIVMVLLLCYSVSFVGFTSLLSILYPLFGQIVVFFLFMLFYHQIRQGRPLRKE